MQIMLNWIHAHPVYSLIIAYNLVGALPTPNDKSSMLYRYIFAAGHGAIVNIPRIIATKFGFAGVSLNADQK